MLRILVPHCTFLAFEIRYFVALFADIDVLSTCCIASYILAM